MRSRTSKNTHTPNKFYKSLWFVIFAPMFSFSHYCEFNFMAKNISIRRSFNLPRRWLAALRDTNHHPQCFSVPSSITKSEPTPEARDPTIFCLTSSGTVSGTRNFFACREALAGCRGEALTRMFGVPTVWREYKHVSCPDFFRLNTGRASTVLRR